MGNSQKKKSFSEVSNFNRCFVGRNYATYIWRGRCWVLIVNRPTRKKIFERDFEKTPTPAVGSQHLLCRHSHVFSRLGRIDPWRKKKALLFV